MAGDSRIENRATHHERLLSPRFTPGNIRDRMDRRYGPGVKALNEWVDELREDPRLPPGAGATVPYFDPDGGGQHARVLLLMQDPSRVATFTGFISPDNNDPTASNTTTACARAGLERTDRVHWNIFPWWVNVSPGGRRVDDERPPQTFAQARPLAATLLRELLGLLPNLQVLVLCGNEAQKGFDHLDLGALLRARGIRSPLRCPSCSPQSWNNVDRSDPGRRRRSEIIVSVLEEAAR